MFGLSKAEMAEEPLEDIAINFKIEKFLSKKQEAEHAMMEERAKSRSKG